MSRKSKSHIDYIGQELLECEAEGMNIYTPHNILLSYKTLPEYLLLIDKILLFINKLIEKIISISIGKIKIHNQLDLISTNINMLPKKLHKLTQEKYKPRNSMLLMKKKNNETMRCNDGRHPELYNDIDTNGRNIYCCDDTPSSQIDKHGRKFSIDYYIDIINQLLKKLNTLVDTIPINIKLSHKKEEIKTTAGNINDKIHIINEIIKNYKLNEHIFAIPSKPKTKKRHPNNNIVYKRMKMPETEIKNVFYPSVKVKVSYNHRNRSIKPILKRKRSSSNNKHPHTKKKVHYNNVNSIMNKMGTHTEHKPMMGEMGHLEQMPQMGEMGRVVQPGAVDAVDTVDTVNPVDTLGDLGNLGDLVDIDNMDDIYKAIFAGAFSPKKKEKK